MSNEDANHVWFIHAHQIAKNTCRNGTSASSAWPSSTAWAKRLVSAATAITNVRSKSSSSGLAVRCDSPIGRAVMRMRMGRVTRTTTTTGARVCDMSQNARAVWS